MFRKMKAYYVVEKIDDDTVEFLAGPLSYNEANKKADTHGYSNLVLIVWRFINVEL